MPSRIKELLQSEYHTQKMFEEIKDSLNSFGVDISEVSPRELFEEIIDTGEFKITSLDKRYAKVRYFNNRFKVEVDFVALPKSRQSN